MHTKDRARSASIIPQQNQTWAYGGYVDAGPDAPRIVEFDEDEPPDDLPESSTQAGGRSVRDNYTRSDEARSEYDIQERISELLSALEKSRGTGQHICPYQYTCEKGGVENGRLKTFGRNSDFRFVQ